MRRQPLWQSRNCKVNFSAASFSQRLEKQKIGGDKRKTEHNQRRPCSTRHQIDPYNCCGNCNTYSLIANLSDDPLLLMLLITLSARLRQVNLKARLHWNCSVHMFFVCTGLLRTAIKSDARWPVLKPVKRQSQR